MNTQEIKTKANAVPAVLSPTATDCQMQWEGAVSLPIRELSFLTPDLAARPGQGEATLTPACSAFLAGRVEPSGALRRAHAEKSTECTGSAL